MEIGGEDRKKGCCFSSVEILHLPFYTFVESDPEDTDFREEIIISGLISGKSLNNLKEIVVPSRSIDVSSDEATYPRSVRLWNKGRAVLNENEKIKSGKIKLRTLEIGEIGE